MEFMAQTIDIVKITKFLSTGGVIISSASPQGKWLHLENHKSLKIGICGTNRCLCKKFLNFQLRVQEYPQSSSNENAYNLKNKKHLTADFSIYEHKRKPRFSL